MMTFTKEADFEKALIVILSEKGWEKQVLKYPSETNLLNNMHKGTEVFSDPQKCGYNHEKGSGIDKLANQKSAYQA